MSKIKINPKALSERKEWKRHKVKDGSNIYRFLPPFGAEANGYPYRKWMVIWGLVDPITQRMRPYASSLTTEQKCPVFEYVGALQKKAENKKAELQAAGYDDKTVKEMLKPLNKVISEYRLKTVYAWNAVDQAGSVGILELKTTAHKDLKKQMNQYIMDYNQDPTSVNCEQDDSGVWFNVKREGTGFDTTYSVEKSQTMQKYNGQNMYMDNRNALPANVQEGWEDLAYDLGSIYQKKTYDELREILMFNMSGIIADCPDAAVEGFLPTGTPKATIPAPQPVVQPAPTANININLADEDDEPAAYQPPVTPTAAPPVMPTATTEDDPFMAMAEGILKD